MELSGEFYFGGQSKMIEFAVQFRTRSGACMMLTVKSDSINMKAKTHVQDSHHREKDYQKHPGF